MVVVDKVVVEDKAAVSVLPASAGVVLGVVNLIQEHQFAMLARKSY